MDRIFAVLQVIAPIFVTVALGVFARRKSILTSDQMQGVQQFVIKFCVPCVLFNSCYSANFTIESVASMAMVPPTLLAASIWSFKARKKTFPYHNLPILFAAQESGMLGIPLFLTLFGAAQVYRIGVLDIAQSWIAIPVIAILASKAESGASPKEILKAVFSSPLMLMGLLGFILNLSGIAAWLDMIGIGSSITASTGFIAQPVSAAMLFSVGFNFSFDAKSRNEIIKISAIHFIAFAAVGLIMEGILMLLPDVAFETRIAVLLYMILPASYLAPSLGRREEEYAVASGVCSVLTAVTLILFVAIAAIAR